MAGLFAGSRRRSRMGRCGYKHGVAQCPTGGRRGYCLTVGIDRWLVGVCRHSVVAGQAGDACTTAATGFNVDGSRRRHAMDCGVAVAVQVRVAVAHGSKDQGERRQPVLRFGSQPVTGPAGLPVSAHRMRRLPWNPCAGVACAGTPLVIAAVNDSSGAGCSRAGPALWTFVAAWERRRRAAGDARWPVRCAMRLTLTGAMPAFTMAFTS